MTEIDEDLKVGVFFDGGGPTRRGALELLSKLTEKHQEARRYLRILLSQEENREYWLDKLSHALLPEREYWKKKLNEENE